MLIRRLTVKCTFLIALTFFINYSLAHNAIVLEDSFSTGQYAHRSKSLMDWHSGEHESIQASAYGSKKIKWMIDSYNIHAQSGARVNTKANLTLPDGSVVATRGAFEVWVYIDSDEGTGLPTDDDCGMYQGAIFKSGLAFMFVDEDDIEGSLNISDIDIDALAEVDNQIDEEAECNISI
jgi:hypothetical protein